MNDSSFVLRSKSYIGLITNRWPAVMGRSASSWHWKFEEHKEPRVLCPHKRPAKINKKRKRGRRGASGTSIPPVPTLFSCSEKEEQIVVLKKIKRERNRLGFWGQTGSSESSKLPKETAEILGICSRFCALAAAAAAVLLLACWPLIDNDLERHAEVQRSYQVNICHRALNGTLNGSFFLLMMGNIRTWAAMMQTWPRRTAASPWTASDGRLTPHDCRLINSWWTERGAGYGNQLKKVFNLAGCEMHHFRFHPDSG